MRWADTCRRMLKRVVSACTYPYPANSITWKNSIQVFHTAGVPPNSGRTILAIMGCTRKRRNALKKRDIAKSVNMQPASNTQWYDQRESANHPTSAEAPVRMILENWVPGRARIAGTRSGSRLLGEKKTVNV